MRPLPRQIILVSLLLVAALRLGSLYWHASIKSVQRVSTKRTHPQKLFFLHYHKTGHDLSAKVALAGFHRQARRYKAKELRQNILPDQTNSSEIALVDGAEFYLPELESWLLPTTRVVHLVRDSFDWCLSAYLYHSQSPIPVRERKWIDKHDPDPCRIRDNTFAKQILHIDLESVSALCQSLVKESAQSSLYKQLQSLSRPQGLMLEAARGLLGARHGDLMRMAHNTYISNRWQVQTYKLSQFTSSRSSFQQAVQRICIFGNIKETTRSVDECVQDATKFAYLDPSQSSSSDHVTMHHLKDQERQDLKNMLRQNPILGPPLEKINSFVHQTWKRNWKDA